MGREGGGETFRIVTFYDSGRSYCRPLTGFSFFIHSKEGGATFENAT